MTKQPSDDALERSLQQFADELGMTPSRNQVYEDEDHTFRSGLYEDRFGSWNAALEAAGLEINRPRSYSEAELLDELADLASEIGRVPRQKDLKTAEDRPAVATYYRTFGSWNDALAALEYEPNAEKQVPNEQLIAELQRVADEMGRPPKYEELAAREETYDPSTYERAFGSWNEALEAAGLERRNRKEIPQEELLQQLEELEDELGRTPHYDDLFEFPTAPCPYTYEQRFGTFSVALKAAGMEPAIEFSVSKEDLARELRAVAGELDRTPTVEEFREMDDVYGVSTYVRKFGTWIEGIEAAGLDPIDWSGENHPRWKGGTEGYQYYGPDWPRQREQALERDGYECVDCGMSNAAHCSEYDAGLHVHHKRPMREYIQSDELTRSEGNRLANLVTLCHACHGKWESLPVQLEQG